MTITSLSSTLRNAVGFLLRCASAFTHALVGTHGGCRFVPSCSRYGVDAVSRHGVVLGLWFLAGRLLRCRPGGPLGLDPVPDAKNPRRSLHRSRSS